MRCDGAVREFVEEAEILRLIREVDFCGLGALQVGQILVFVCHLGGVVGLGCGESGALTFKELLVWGSGESIDCGRLFAHP
jgi:hypothetical protein